MYSTEIIWLATKRNYITEIGECTVLITLQELFGKQQIDNYITEIGGCTVLIIGEINGCTIIIHNIN